jgi:integration host factor subunit beta
MTKSELIERISQRMPRVPKRDVEVIVHTVFESMLDALQRAQRIEIRGFGSFAVKTRQPRAGRNPKTGQKVDVPQRRIPHFTVGKELRERLNQLAQPAPAPITASSYLRVPVSSSPASVQPLSAREPRPRY